MVWVTDSGGTEWRISRRLFHRPRFRGRADMPDLGYVDVPVVDSGGLVGIVSALVLIVVLVLAIVLVFPVIVFLAELVLAAALVGVKALLGRWTVVAESDRARVTWRAKGRARSKALAAEVAAALASGATLRGGGSFESIPSEVPLTDVDVREVEREANVRIVDR